LRTYLSNSMSQQRLNHLAVLRVHRDRLYSIDIDVTAREFVAKSENRLATFGRIWIALHFVPELAASHTRTFSETELHLVLCSYAILQHLLGTQCMQSIRTSIKWNRFVFFVKKCANWLQMARTENGEGRGGLATCVCNANEHGPPQLFYHCCAYTLHWWIAQ